ncbi:MAG: phenylpyruvate tautomerase MIF-related protein [Oscillospiraceae bacterium]
MPFINTKYSQSITQEQEETLKSELGKAIAIIGKSENWLMVGFEQNCTLYFAGEKSEKIAFVDVSMYGGASASSCNMMTKEICRIYGNVLGVPADKIYVKYTATDNWGWNGGNF